MTALRGIYRSLENINGYKQDSLGGGRVEITSNIRKLISSNIMKL
jgi:hypothetical protein